MNQKCSELLEKTLKETHKAIIFGEVRDPEQIMHIVEQMSKHPGRTVSYSLK